MTTPKAKARAAFLRLGRCYELSGRFILDAPASVTSATLVHGSIQGFKAPRMDHAWVEEPERGVWEPVLNEWLDPAAFEALFNPVKFQVYTRREANWCLLKARHWGPWDGTVEALRALTNEAMKL